jgi:hypothetical protein
MARYDKSDMTMAASAPDLDVEPQFEKESGEYRRVLSAGTITGDRVRNPAGEDLGKIEEIMLDIPSGRVAYAVLSFGGILGLGSKLFAVPWEALTINEQDREFVLSVEKSVLENAPGFDKDHWPNMADRSFGENVYGHYGYKPYWESSQATTGTDAMEREDQATFDRDRNRHLSSGGGGSV